MAFMLLLTCAALLTSSLTHARRADIEAVEMDIDALGNEAATTTTSGGNASKVVLPDSLLSLSNDSAAGSDKHRGSEEAAKLSSPPALSTSSSPFSGGYHPCEVCHDIMDSSGSTLDRKYRPDKRRKLGERWIDANKNHFFWTYSLSWGCVDWEPSSTLGKAAKLITCNTEDCEVPIEVSLVLRKHKIEEYVPDSLDEFQSSVKQTQVVTFSGHLGNFTADSHAIQLYDEDEAAVDMKLLLVYLTTTARQGCGSGMVDRNGKMINFLDMAMTKLGLKRGEIAADVSVEAMRPQEAVRVRISEDEPQLARPPKQTIKQWMMKKARKEKSDKSLPQARVVHTDARMETGIPPVMAYPL